jgi:hypothetical protein
MYDTDLLYDCNSMAKWIVIVDWLPAENASEIKKQSHA